MSAPADRLHALLSPVVEGAGADLEDLHVSPAGRRRVVRVVVDRDGGISLDDVAELSRLLSEALDDVDAREPALLGGAYVLEVSSPGVDRPLVLLRHWRRNTGRLVTAHLREGAPVTGRVLRVEEDGEQVVLDVAGTERVLALADLAKGVVQVEFDRKGAGPQEGEGDDAHDEDDEHDEDLEDLEDDDAEEDL